jgi:hypothetical protein
LTLTAGWGGGNASDLRYGITHQFTDAVSLPLVSHGDTNPLSLISQGFVEIDRRLKFRGALISMSADSAAVGNNVDTLVTLLTTDYDAGGFVADAAQGYFTIPSGIDKVRVSFSAKPSANASAVWRVHVAKNDLTNYAGAPRAYSADVEKWEPLHGTSPPFAVAEGDTIKLMVKPTGATMVVEDHEWTWFAIEAVELD